MRTVFIIILAAIVALPLISWVIYGYSWEISAWFGLVALIALAVIIVHRNQGKKLW